MNNSFLLRIATGLALVFFATGCATITRGTKDTLVVESEPSGANIRLSNGLTGKTPTSFKLPRNKSLIVTIEKDGYEVVNVNVNPQIVGAGAAGMAGNVLVGGLIGVVVDPLSGAMKDLKPNPVKVNLVASPKANAIAPPSAPQPAAPAKTTEESLKELEKLHKEGLISDEEYAKKREQILKTM